MCKTKEPQQCNIFVKENHLNSERRYFDDPWQHLPKDGYTRMFENMLLKVWLSGNKSILLTFLLQDPKITVRVATDYFQVHIVMMRVKSSLWLMYINHPCVESWKEEHIINLTKYVPKLLPQHGNVPNPGEGGAARARAPCLHWAHRRLLCQPGQFDTKKDRVRINVVLTRVCPSLSTEAYSGRKSTWNHRHPKNICTSHICSSITIIMIIIIVVIVVIIYMD